MKNDKIEVMETETREFDKKIETGEQETKEIKQIKKEENTYTNIEKLKCNYTVYKQERRRSKMPIENKCNCCQKDFKEKQEIYKAYKNEKIYIICNKCAKK